MYRGGKLLCNCHWQNTPNFSHQAAAAAVGNIGIPAMIHLENVMKHNLRRSVHRYLEMKLQGYEKIFHSSCNYCFKADKTVIEQKRLKKNLYPEHSNTKLKCSTAYLICF